MTTHRQDLSAWALHFIHDYNPDYELPDQAILYDQYGGNPYHENETVNDRFDSWNISDRYYPVDYGASALNVLLKIIMDGHIRSTWAIRSGRPTIYGPRAAVCFTEMPLYAFLEYATQRKDEFVSSYAIGVLKHELFAAGGRPVIYGLSGKHVEQRRGLSPNKVWPRKLDVSCGIGESEQYRYVAMSTDANRPIDWSHEREWRWVDHGDECSCPGLPIWLSDEPISFSQIFVVVPDSADEAAVLNQLQELHDSGANEFDYPFSRGALEATSVIALDKLELGVSRRSGKNLRLDDIPKSYIAKFQRPKASPDLINKAQFVLAEAKVAGDKAAAARADAAPRVAGGKYIADIAGWAFLVIPDAQSPLVSALLQLDEVYSVPGEGYFVRNIGGLGWDRHQAMSLAEAFVDAAMLVFRRHFPDTSFYMYTRRD